MTIHTTINIKCENSNQPTSKGIRYIKDNNLYRQGGSLMTYMEYKYKFVLLIPNIIISIYSFIHMMYIYYEQMKVEICILFISVYRQYCNSVIFTSTYRLGLHNTCKLIILTGS